MSAGCSAPVRCTPVRPGSLTSWRSARLPATQNPLYAPSHSHTTGAKEGDANGHQLRIHECTAFRFGRIHLRRSTALTGHSAPIRYAPTWSGSLSCYRSEGGQYWQNPYTTLQFTYILHQRNSRRLHVGGCWFSLLAKQDLRTSPSPVSKGCCSIDMPTTWPTVHFVIRSACLTRRPAAAASRGHCRLAVLGASRGIRDWPGYYSKTKKLSKQLSI